MLCESRMERALVQCWVAQRTIENLNTVQVYKELYGERNMVDLL